MPRKKSPSKGKKRSHGSSSKGKERSHGSSSGGSSSQGSSSQQPSIEARAPATEPRDWNWTMENDPKIHLTTNDGLGGLSEAFHHVDFQLSRAWLCFVQENMHGDMGTNHVFLKFDLKASDHHPWLGVKLEASDEQLTKSDSSDEDDQGGQQRKRIFVPASGQYYDPADLILGLKNWSGEPRGLKFCIELILRSDSKTLGGLIDLLSNWGLTSFAFATKEDSVGDNVIVGCRDYIAQVLFCLEARGFIRRQFLEPTVGTSPELAYVTPAGEFECPSPKTLFQNDIFAALACYYETANVRKGASFSAALSYGVEEGFFPNLPNDIRRRDKYPYSVARPFGYMVHQISMLRASQGGSMAGPSSQIRQGPTYPALPPLDRFDAFLPQIDQDFLLDPKTGSWYYIHRSTGEWIYGDPLTRQPYRDQWPFNSR